MKYKDYYKTLGLDRKASTEDIKKAYRRLARKYHPDVSKEHSAEEKFKDINEANDVLGDPEKRAAYDQLGYYQAGQDFRPPPGWGGRAGQGGFNPSDAGGMDFGDLFSQLFGAQMHGQGARGGPRGAVRGRDVETEVGITLDEAFHGTERSLSLNSASLDSQTVKVRIPAGSLPGRRLRVVGKGGQVAHGKAGDLYLRINVAPHALYRLEGKDIYLDTPITPWEAALGASLDVPTLSGRVRVKTPPGTRSGQKLRLTGRGMPASDGPGDFFVQLQVVLPSRISDEERALYEKLGALSDFNPRAHFPG